jgi:hypothetical protein
MILPASTRLSSPQTLSGEAATEASPGARRICRKAVTKLSPGGGVSDLPRSGYRSAPESTHQ